MKQITDNKKQAGVTLLMTILVLAGVTLITITISSFAINELRASRAVIVTEPAITAAESSGEQGIWELKRTGTIQTTSSVLGNSTVSNKSVLYGSATFTIQANTAYSFYLYDPNNINGDVDLSGFPYTWLSLIHKSGAFQVSINIVRIDGTVVANTVVNPGSSQTINIPSVLTGLEGRMKVTLSSLGDITVDVNTNQGMPDFPTVDSTGCAAQTGLSSCTSSPEAFIRRLNIVVPK